MVEFHKTGAKLFIQLAAGMGRSMAINGWMTMLAKTTTFLNKIVSPIVDVAVHLRLRFRRSRTAGRRTSCPAR